MPATAEPDLYPNDVPEAPPDGLHLLERKHVAHMLGVSIRKVGQLTSSGRVPGSMSGIAGMGRARLYVRATVEAWIAAGCPAPGKWRKEWK